LSLTSSLSTKVTTLRDIENPPAWAEGLCQTHSK
jgi:hypothetical protein